MAFNPFSASQGLSGMLSGIMGQSSSPYSAMMDQFKKYYGQAQDMQQPFYQAGVNAIPDYQNWLNSQKDPSQFINNLMGQYSASPWAQYQQKQSMNAGTNAASASGLTGSTPFMQASQQNARDISSQDQNQWLQNVLGINTQYGQGEGNLVGMGQQSANQMSDMLTQLAQLMGKGAMGQDMGKSMDLWNLLGGGAQLGMSFFGG